MVRLILVRHGETELNARHVFQGSTNLPLNDGGVLQAEALARCLAPDPIDRLISSSLQRAAQTAEIIATGHPDQPQVLLDPRLLEVNFGRWEGLNEMQIEEVLPGEVQEWKRNPSFAPSEGESMLQAMERVKGLLDELRFLPAGHRVVVVAHGAILQALICSALDILPRFWWPFHLYNSSISKVWLYEQGATLVGMNYLDHLAETGLPQDYFSLR